MNEMKSRGYVTYIHIPMWLVLLPSNLIIPFHSKLIYDKDFLHCPLQEKIEKATLCFSKEYLYLYARQCGSFSKAPSAKHI